MSFTDTIDNTQEYIDSRDVIARIEYLEGVRQDLEDELEVAQDELEHATSEQEEQDAQERIEEAEFDLHQFDDGDEGEELEVLKALQDEAKDSPDWEYGETLIHEDSFTDYIEELINDCYNLPKELDSGEWPYRHMTIDYEAAAEEAKQDYLEVDFAGETYYIRG